jgi:gamma-glutamyltranspeptidase/glutathione hydrolase
VPRVQGRLVANRVEGGKRPRSAMAPTLVLASDGGLRLVLGAQGGARIPGVTVQSLVEMLDFQQTPEQALAAPRVLTLGTTADLEAGPLAARLAEALTARGQSVSVQSIDWGALAIAVTPSGLRGGADTRREGVALGE